MSAEGGPARQLTEDPAQDRTPRWSPDGNRLVFASDRTGRHELYLITRENPDAEWGTPRQLTSDGAFNARWSLDGTEILYVSDPSQPSQDIKIVSVEAGRSRVLVRHQLPEPTPAIARWSSDGNTVYYMAFYEDEMASLWSVSAQGGTPELLVRFDDPTRQAVGNALDLSGLRLYFTLSQFESNISVTELLTKE